MWSDLFIFSPFAEAFTMAHTACPRVSTILSVHTQDFIQSPQQPYKAGSVPSPFLEVRKEVDKDFCHVIREHMIRNKTTAIWTYVFWEPHIMVGLMCRRFGGANREHKGAETGEVGGAVPHTEMQGRDLWKKGWKEGLWWKSLSFLCRAHPSQVYGQGGWWMEDTWIRHRWPSSVPTWCAGIAWAQGYVACHKYCWGAKAALPGGLFGGRSQHSNTEPKICGTKAMPFIILFYFSPGPHILQVWNV